MASSSSDRPSSSPITCHVLDTTTGRPAKFIRVTLSCRDGGEKLLIFRTSTDNDGRVKVWPQAIPSTGDAVSLHQLVQDRASGSLESMVFCLTFDTEAYFGKGQTFFPEVEIKFTLDLKAKGHLHVPLLLGPYNYTTYRGS